MCTSAPHFHLFSESNKRNHLGEWKFVLQAADGSATLEATDNESECSGERLELLAVVRGLEALDQPSRVTVITSSKYVNRGVTYGLEEWRRNDWTWECFGEMVPVKNADLWQRLDRAAAIHSVEYRGPRIDAAHQQPPRPRGPFFAPRQGSRQPRPSAGSPVTAVSTAAANDAPNSARRKPGVVSGAKRGGLRRRLGQRMERLRFQLSQLGTQLLPSPWLG